MSKVLRLLLQSMMLGLGAYLVIRQELTAGAMIAASIMMGRALAPIETAIANWRGFVAARQSIERLSEALARAAPKRRSDRAAEAGAQPRRRAGHGCPAGGDDTDRRGRAFRPQSRARRCGIIGPSGAGKTSLVRTLVGIWRPAKGSVRLDGAALDQWDPEASRPALGFISQTVELFDGTIAENIARMSIEPDADAVLRPPRAAGAHDMILRLPSGYDTRDRRRGSDAVGRAAATHCAGARLVRRPIPGRARRAELQPRQRGRARHCTRPSSISRRGAPSSC